MVKSVSDEYRIYINQLLQAKLAIAENAFKRRFSLPEIQYNQRGRIAGTAHLERWMIRLNPILLNENGTPFIDEVLPHELAHLIVYRVYGKVRPHGKEWQYVMESLFNQQAKTRHSFDTQSVMGKTFPYQCACQTHQLTIRRHNRVVRRETTYHCRRCGERLSPISSEK